MSESWRRRAQLAGSVIGVAAAFWCVSFLIPWMACPCDASGGSIWWYILGLIALGLTSAITGWRWLHREESTLAYGLIWGPLVFLLPFMILLLKSIADFMAES